ncbi:hypothetical protein BS17DRAFT_103691 [Gyrodon lividus]|nr:hypothetical protein BS17DRAFT_103691 [Gyrodon lividus]
MRAELRRRRPAQQARTHWQGASARNAHQRTNTGATGYADSVWGEDDGDGAFVRARASELGQTQRAMRWDEALRYASFAVIAVVSLAAIGFHSYHTRVEHHTRTAAANLAQARAEAQEFGMERRRRIRERVVEAKMLETARAEDTRRIEELQPVGRQDHPSVDERS